MQEITKPPYNVNVSDGVYIICGGVLMYFHTSDMKRFFLALLDAFPGGGICFDGENQKGLEKSNKIVQKTGNGTKIYFPIENAKELFASWSPDFKDVSEMAFPNYIKKSREIAWKWKFVLSLGMKLGMVKLIEVGF